MSQVFYVVDAFTDSPFRGNPAAVCIMDAPMADKLMFQIAREMNLSETAFIVPLDEKEGIFSLRWLTPLVEVDLCGHATIASSWVLFKENNKIVKENNLKELKFETRSGRLTVQLAENDENLLQMNFPLGNPQKLELEEEIQQEIMKSFSLRNSIEEIEAIQFCQRTKKLLIHLKDFATIELLQPSSSALLNVGDLINNIHPNVSIRGIIVTSSCGINDQSEYKKYDFISRYFAPWVGIPEDPVTGSAHTVLAKYWSEVLGANGRQLSAFQAFPLRGGEVFMQVLGDTERVLLKGTAVVVSKGELFLPK